MPIPRVNMPKNMFAVRTYNKKCNQVISGGLGNGG
jgi:hypothetical protein